MKATLVGGDALVTNEFWQIAGEAGNGTLMTFASNPRRRPTAAMHTGTWQTVLGPITFDKKGGVTVSDYVFYIWANGSYAET